MRQQHNDGIKPLQVVNITVIVLLVLFGAYFFTQYRSAKDKVALTKEEEVAQLVKEVGDKYLLPTGEDPEIATVQDVSKLAGQDFFANAKDGDKLLIYEQAKLAFIYRESIDKIINSGPISVTADAKQAINDATEPTIAVDPEPVAKLNIAIHGTDEQVEEALATLGSSLKGHTVSKLAPVGSIAANLVFGSSEGSSELIQAISESLAFEQSTGVPAGYENSNADILILFADPTEQ